jgi:predicted phage terminase large subunit-like protein
MALDPSKGSDARLGDYSAFVMVGVNAEGIAYVEADLRRRPVEEIVAEGVEWHRRFQPDVFACEANAWQDLLGADFETEFARQGLLSVRPWTLENHEPKVVRIRRLGPWLSQRRLRFKAASAGTQLLIEQLKDFPVGEHDDGPDALEMALRLAQQYLAPRGDGLGDRLLLGP